MYNVHESFLDDFVAENEGTQKPHYVPLLNDVQAIDAAFMGTTVVRNCLHLLKRDRQSKQLTNFSRNLSRISISQLLT